MHSKPTMHSFISLSRRLMIPFLLFSNTILLVAILVNQGVLTDPSLRCGKAPDGWNVIVTRPHQNACADVIRSHTLEGTNILRIFDHGALKIANADAIPCHLCNPLGNEVDPLVDMTWHEGTLRVFTLYGNPETMTENWNFVSRQGEWVLSSWERTLKEGSNGPYWEEHNDTESQQVSIAVLLNTDESLCLNASENVQGCTGANLSPPIQKSCRAGDLSSEISRITKFRFRTFGCDMPELVEAAKNASSTGKKTYQVVPLDDFEPPAPPRTSDFNARQI